MHILISIIIYMIIFGLLWWCIGILPLPAPISQIVQVLFVLLLILMILSVVGIIPGSYFPLIHLN